MKFQVLIGFLPHKEIAIFIACNVEIRSKFQTDTLGQKVYGRRVNLSRCHTSSAVFCDQGGVENVMNVKGALVAG